jgi:TonB-dependent SusC/RagA subfamily outer membrane receptor
LFAQRTIEGTVTDSKSGETLVGVSVLIKGTQSGTISDLNGKYRLFSAQLTDNSVIVYSYVGYKPIEEIPGKRTVIDISLVSSQVMLEELVVIGYGSVKKRNVLGAVTSVNNKELTRLPLADVTQALQGRAAGVQVTQNTGAPGEGVSVRIRGAGSINSSNDPLYIVDGIPTADALRILSPGDIENITVLKDASAAAIYGSRANNGVVLVTTKKGTKGATKVTYRGQTGFQKATRLPQGAERDALWIDMARLLEFYGAARISMARPRNMVMQKHVIGYKKHPIILADWLYADIDLEAKP